MQPQKCAIVTITLLRYSQKQHNLTNPNFELQTEALDLTLKELLINISKQPPRIHFIRTKCADYSVEGKWRSHKESNLKPPDS